MYCSLPQQIAIRCIMNYIEAKDFWRLFDGLYKYYLLFFKIN